MAGGNLSPRQKMINMMYLVLTALLALNVSAEILEAFNSLRESLRESYESVSVKNEETKSSINSKVDEEVGQGNSKNLIVKTQLQQLSEKTRTSVKHIEDILNELSEIAEKDKETGEFHAMGELENNFRLWMGNGEEKNSGRGDGEAIKLKENINGYVDWANKFLKDDNPNAPNMKDRFEHLATDPKGKKWEYSTFHGKPVIADMAMLEKFKSDIVNIEGELIGYLKAKLGAVTFKIDSLIPVDAPFSQVVAAGMYFETKLYVAMSSKEIKPEFSGSGQITNEPGGNSATMKILASGGFESGKNEKEQSYSARIKVPKTDGTMAELKVEGKFKVRKPEVVISSASVQNLYWNCGNALNFEVPALGDLYDPRISASEAEVLPSSNNKKTFTIVPRGKTCIVSVASLTNGQNIKIDDIKYKVIKPPRPNIELLYNNILYNGAAPIPKKSDCLVRIKADGDFLAALPKDARYAITKIELLVGRGLGAPQKAGDFSGDGVDGTKGVRVELGKKLGDDSPGTRIYFKIDKVLRINFQNKKVEEDFADKDLYVSAVIK